MSWILAIETSTDNCSVALAKNTECVASISENNRNSHSTILPLFINEVIKIANLNIEDIDAVAVSQGPGSFTGLRIGVSVAKGICFALYKPLIAINTLQSLVSGVKSKMNEETLLLSLIDSGAQECYYAIYNDCYSEVVPPDSAIVDEKLFKTFPTGKNYLIAGYRIHKWTKFLADYKNVSILEDVYPDALHLSDLAFTKFENNDFVSVNTFEPYYLRDFKARDFSIKINNILFPKK